MSETSMYFNVQQQLRFLKGNDLVSISLKESTVEEALKFIRDGLRDNPRIIRKVLGKSCKLILNYMFKNGTIIKSPPTILQKLDGVWITSTGEIVEVDESEIGTKFIVVSSPDDVPTVQPGPHESEIDDLYKRDSDRYNR